MGLQEDPHLDLAAELLDETTLNEARPTEHIREIAFNEEIHNNKRERLNGEIRQREKVMRRLKFQNPQYFQVIKSFTIS